MCSVVGKIVKFPLQLSKGKYHPFSLQTFYLRYLNSNTASICKIHRNIYARTYPTTVVLPDGSSITVRYNEPRKIIKLPLDLSTLSEEEKKSRIQKRRPKQKVKIEDDIDDGFDASKYFKLIKK